MKYLLDTNVILELRKTGDGVADRNVLAWIGSEEATSFFISALTLLELERGIVSAQRRNPTQATKLRTWLDDYVRPEFSERTLPIDDLVSTRCAHLPIPDRRNRTAGLIAATALVHSMVLVSRNVGVFSGMGLVVVDPWQT